MTKLRVYRGQRRANPSNRLEVLEAGLVALNAETESLVFQHNNSMELNLALRDQDVFDLEIVERNRKRAELELQIAKARAALKTPGHAQALVAEGRLSELRKLKGGSLDYSKLVRLCEELNAVYAEGCYFAAIMLVRAILDHVPPVFLKPNFAQVAANYKGGRNFKKAVDHLERTARSIADQHLHTQMGQNEALPTQQQLNFAPDLDVLLAEIVKLGAERVHSSASR